MNHYPKLIWDDNSSINTKIKAIYNLLNWLSQEMGIGRVPNNKKELKNDIAKTEAQMTTPLSIAFVRMVEKGDIDEITASENAKLFVAWDTVSSYVINEYREFNGKLYKCLQAHNGQEGWEPDKTPALWKLIGIDNNGVVEWSQPISAADAYNTDDIVLYNGVYYKSITDGNVWAPDIYPQGWQEVNITE